MGCSGWEDILVDWIELEESRRCWAVEAASDAGELVEAGAIYVGLLPVICCEIKDSRLAGRRGMILRPLRGRDRYIDICSSSVCARLASLEYTVVSYPSRTTPLMRNAERFTVFWRLGSEPGLVCIFVYYL